MTSTRAGLVALSRSAALDVAGDGIDGITVNAVCPGLIRTARALDSVKGLADSRAVEDGIRVQAGRIPAGRLAEPREVAEVIAFLASDAASFVTCEAVGVHGGELFAGYPPA